MPLWTYPGYMDHLGPPRGFSWKVTVPAVPILVAGLLWIFYEEGRGTASARLVDRLGVQVGFGGASRVEVDDADLRYVVVELSVVDAGVWATDIDPSGEGPGVVVPADDDARELTEGPILPEDHPVALAAADRIDVLSAETCELPKK